MDTSEVVLLKKATYSVSSKTQASKHGFSVFLCFSLIFLLLDKIQSSPLVLSDGNWSLSLSAASFSLRRIWLCYHPCYMDFGHCRFLEVVLRLRFFFLDGIRSVSLSGGSVWSLPSYSITESLTVVFSGVFAPLGGNVLH